MVLLRAEIQMSYLLNDVPMSKELFEIAFVAMTSSDTLLQSS
jgi:hypothetical protein